MVYGVYNRPGRRENKAKQSQIIFHRGERRARRAKKEIQSTSYFSAFFALSAVNLKKQSQFDDEQIGVNSYLKGRYEKTHILRAAKTKPISDEAPAD
jgi:hypothetical protein